MKSILETRINSYEKLEKYIDYLIDNDMMYHFDDDAENILSNTTNQPAFEPEQCIELNKRRNEMFLLDYEYAFDYAYNKMKHLWQ